MLYGAVAALSLLATPFLFGFLLWGSLLTVGAAAGVGASVRSGPRQDRAVVAVCCGLALLTGPTAYLLLANVT